MGIDYKIAYCCISDVYWIKMLDKGFKSKLKKEFIDKETKEMIKEMDNWMPIKVCADKYRLDISSIRDRLRSRWLDYSRYTLKWSAMRVVKEKFKDWFCINKFSAEHNLREDLVKHSVDELWMTYEGEYVSRKTKKGRLLRKKKKEEKKVRKEKEEEEYRKIRREVEIKLGWRKILRSNVDEISKYFWVTKKYMVRIRKDLWLSFVWFRNKRTKKRRDKWSFWQEWRYKEDINEEYTIEDYLKKKILSVSSRKDLSQEYLLKVWNLQWGICPYSLKKIDFRYKNHKTRLASSLDRVNNELWYIEWNVLFCSFMMNTYKSDMTMSEIEEIRPKLYRNIMNIWEKLKEEWLACLWL